eukprot:CAMPEP_0178991544 /NCGR_PEP_ID=MMETSP0795-20121207/5592_1 /TAXON_ID=88552 /ORGANISM="Amoebophrya sp., Strain Ameob2" /LENGTH=295 /DNA_ID=CAMNT_0020683275 /DNA_START=325 /DNA_END=1212 /DNA_ORIENTATION=-
MSKQLYLPIPPIVVYFAPSSIPFPLSAAFSTASFAAFRHVLEGDWFRRNQSRRDLGLRGIPLAVRILVKRLELLRLVALRRRPKTTRGVLPEVLPPVLAGFFPTGARTAHPEIPRCDRHSFQPVGRLVTARLQFLKDFMCIRLVAVVHEGHGHPLVADSTCAPDPVYEVVRALRAVILHHQRHVRNVQPASSHVGRNHHGAALRLEVCEGGFSLALVLVPMDGHGADVHLGEEALQLGRRVLSVHENQHQPDLPLVQKQAVPSRDRFPSFHFRHVHAVIVDGYAVWLQSRAMMYS